MQAITYYRQARFLTSAAKLQQAPPDQGCEVAFAGRSNAGKSSAINRLCDQKSLARTSKTPGRTRLLNFFELDEQRRLVDLPGYGYAKVATGIRQEWQGTLAQYLEQRQCLSGLILLVDVRHSLKQYDRQLLDWAARIQLPVHVLLTKADKLKRGPAGGTLLQLTRALVDWDADFSAQLFSALKGQGVNEAYRVLDGWLARPGGGHKDPYDEQASPNRPS